MTSTTTNLRKINHAVIELIDESIHVTLVYQLENFSRNWITDPSTWPNSVVWFNDNDIEDEDEDENKKNLKIRSGDIVCRILKIDSKFIFLLSFHVFMFFYLLFWFIHFNLIAKEACYQYVQLYQQEREARRNQLNIEYLTGNVCVDVSNHQTVLSSLLDHVNQIKNDIENLNKLSARHQLQIDKIRTEHTIHPVFYFTSIKINKIILL